MIFLRNPFHRQPSFFRESRVIFLASVPEGEKFPREYVHGMDAIRREAESGGRAKEIFEKLNRPITSNHDCLSTINDIGIWERKIARLKMPDQADIKNALGEPDLNLFFGADLKERLNHAEEQMIKRDRLSNLVFTENKNPNLVRQVTEEWEKEKGRLKDHLNFLEERSRAASGEEERGQIFEEIEETKNALNNEINWINRRINELEAEREVANEMEKILEELSQRKDLPKETAERMRKEATDEGAKKRRIHKRIITLEKQSAANVAFVLGYENKIRMISVFLEAKAMRRAQVLRYLKGRYATIRRKFETLRDAKPPRISGDSAKKIEKYLNDFSIITLPSELLDQKALLELPGNLDQTEKALDEISEETKILSQVNKEDLERQWQAVEQAISPLNKNRLDSMMKKLEAEERLRLKKVQQDEVTPYDKTFGRSPVYLGKKSSLIFAGLLAGAEGYEAEAERFISNLDEKHKEKTQKLFAITKYGLRGMRRKIKNIDRQNNDPDEVLDLLTTLGHLSKKMPDFSRSIAMHESAQARSTIDAISKNDSTKSIKRVLEKNLGAMGEIKCHYIDEGQFKARHEKFTSGLMLLKKTKEGRYTIIISKKALKKAHKDQFKKEIIHELLHIEFEKNFVLKDQLIKAYTGNKDWRKIQEAFTNAFPKKRPPRYKGEKTENYAPEDWPDEYMVNELYAMQNEIKKGEGVFGNLKKVIKEAEIEMDFSHLATAGEAAAELGINEDIYLGAESDEGEEGASGGEGKRASEGVVSGEGKGEITKDQQEIVKLNKGEIEKHEKNIQGYLDSPHIRYLPGMGDLLKLMKKYNDQTKHLNDRLKSDYTGMMADHVKKRIKQIEGDWPQIEKKFAEAAEQSPNEDIGMMRDLWNRSNFMSLNDIFQVGVDIKEWWTRRHNRKKADHSARIGTALFENLPAPILGEFGAEASARQQKAEMDEVSEWESRLSNKDAWQLLGQMDAMAQSIDPNKDQLKAILRTLAKKGRIDWRRPSLWTVLSKLQSAVSLSPNDETLLKNPTLLNSSLHKALGQIYDYDEYPTLNRDNESAYESGKQKEFPNLDKIQGQLKGAMDDMLAKHIGGGQVNPQDYEAIIEYCVDKGKASAEYVFFHLMMGQATGLLAPDRGLVLDKKLNSWPATQWIYSKSPPLTQKDYDRIAKDHFEKSYKAGKPLTDFKDFYWSEVQNDPMVIQRVRKSVGERGWDHDWGRSIMPLGDANTAKQSLAGRNGQQETKDTAVENAYVGALQWLEANAINPEKIETKKEYARQMAWIAMADGILSHTAYDPGSAKDTYARSNASMLNGVPREAGEGNHGTWTTREHRDQIRKFMDQFDEEFFKMLRDSKAVRDDKKKHGIKVRDYLIKRYPGLETELADVTDIDHIFDKMDAIMMAIVSSQGDKALLGKIKWLRRGITQ